MADAPTSSGPGSTFFIFLAISALVFLSASRPSTPSGQGLLQQAIPVAQTTGNNQSSAQSTNPPTIYLDGISGAGRKTPEEEYVRIKASSFNKAAVNISGWELRSLTRFGLYIPPGVRTLHTGVVNPLQSIVLDPGESALVNSGRSPLGVSFQANICSAYLNQYQRFNPPFDESVCPEFRDEEHLFIAAGLDNACIDYIETLPRCRYPESRLQGNLTAKCREYIFNNLNYNACVGRHRNDPGFHTGEWRVFLGQTRDLWKDSRESIFLLDSKSSLVNTLRY